MKTITSNRQRAFGCPSLSDDLPRRFLACLGAAVLAVQLAPPAYGAALVVASGCTLPDAITAANNDSVAGGCAAGSGADVIHLVDDVVLTSAAPDTTHGFGPVATPVITSPITIRGNGHSVSTADGLTGGVFGIADTGSLELHSIVVRDAMQTGQSGGAARNLGLLQIYRSEFRNNEASQGGAISNGGTLEVEDSVFAQNSASHTGGAIQGNGTIRILRSTFEGNISLGGHTSFKGGGAITTHSPNSTTIEDCVFDSNFAEVFGTAEGGALHASGGTTRVDRSTFFGNQAVGGSGARGGAVHKSGGSLEIFNSTFHDNLATSSSGESLGGAIYREFPGSCTFAHNTFTSNSLAPATDTGGAAIYDAASDPVTTVINVIAQGQNVQCVGSGLIDSGGNFGCLSGPAVTGLDPDLAFNGGPTPTHALLPGSNAINAGGTFCVFPLPTDQRFAQRVGNCDSGAFEFGGCEDDRYELAGTPPMEDNFCPGPRMALSGVPESRRSCNVDWMYFSASASAAYTVETSMLTGGADTEISLWSNNCGTNFASDDNSGQGLASKVEFSGVDDLVAVKVEDAGGTYGNGRGYDITVSCTGLCDCPAPNGLNFDFSNRVVAGPEAFEVCRALYGINVTTVEDGGTLLLAAGESVAIGNGFSVEEGGRLVVMTDDAIRSPL